MNDMLRRNRHPLETILKVRFRELTMLQTALTHSSVIQERAKETLESNERLEFLGDAFLGQVIAEELFSRFPTATEGQLTEMRSWLVRRETLGGLATELRVGEYLVLGHGEERSGGRAKERTLAGCFEALLGALLLDQGFEKARQITARMFSDLLDAPLPYKGTENYKTKLQELIHAEGRELPTYQTVADAGPGHSDRFTVTVALGEHVVATGTGSSKQKAERAAAREAYRLLAEKLPRTD